MPAGDQPPEIWDGIWEYSTHPGQPDLITNDDQCAKGKDEHSRYETWESRMHSGVFGLEDR